MRRESRFVNGLRRDFTIAKQCLLLCMECCFLWNTEFYIVLLCITYIVIVYFISLQCQQLTNVEAPFGSWVTNLKKPSANPLSCHKNQSE